MGTRDIVSSAATSATTHPVEFEPQEELRMSLKSPICLTCHGDTIPHSQALPLSHSHPPVYPLAIPRKET